jgi:carboxypeptidase Taq
MTAYDRLIAKLKRVHVLGTVSGLLGWDEQVNLPADSADLRAEQLALIAELHHAAASDREIGQLLDEVEAELREKSASQNEATFDERVVVREARRDYERVTKLPPEFVAERARLSSAAYHAWAKAKPANDFSGYAPFLERQLELAKREANYLGWGDRPYDYAIDKHDPGLSAVQIDALFAELRAGLVPLVRRINAVATERAPVRLRGFPVARQQQFLREVTEQIGFDYRRGRIDVSLHPFCEGAGADVRMTTRFHEDDPLNTLFGAVHETGHGLYEQGLPLVDQGTPLGQNAGMAVHESQSRMWENQVARSRSFWQHYERRYRELFPEQLAKISSDDLYRAINAVRPTFIRVDADEVHYNLHIILRFELEKKLFAGELTVRDLPGAWHALSMELFGAAPPDDRQGVLQDIHWSGGAFGYFPSYCLGNMIAAQNWAAVRQALPGLEDDFARGDFRRLLDWLRTHIHAQGRRYHALDLVKRVTGEPLSARPLLAYLENRYGALYR